MIYLIVGHRGTGKTLWLKKIKTVVKNSIFLDLDKQIEQQTKKTISQLFLDKKIEGFRVIEKKVLKKVINQHKNQKDDVFIAIGAGFKWSSLKIPYYVIYLMRETDNRGRIFLDRPCLTKNKTPYQEYLSLYSQREKQYQKIKQESFVLPEQDFTFTEGEKLLLLSDHSKKINICITLNKNTLPVSKKLWKHFIYKRLSWGICFFELRDDQVNSQDLNYLLTLIPQKKQLLSIRKSFFLKKDLSSTAIDWPIERGLPSLGFTPLVVSLHKRTTQTFKQLYKKLLKYKASYFKLAVPVKNITELKQGHLWFLEDPKKRCFLPISIQQNNNSSWRWYRQIFGPFMKLHFIKESRWGLPDQPFLYEHLIASAIKQNKLPLFGAVIGSNINYSASPAFYRKPFLKKGMVFTKISMEESEFTKRNLNDLQQIGLVCVAVTSPLKKKAFRICDKYDSTASKARSVNTLVFKNKKWYGSSTDSYGFKALLKQNGISNTLSIKNNKHICIWGGGGVKKILEQQLPQAYFYSARTGEPLNKTISKKKQSLNIAPDIVIWAVGRNRMSSCVFPPISWSPKKIIDLNYTQDSPGLEYALKVKAKYISGFCMFQNQAKKQLEYFLKR